MTPAERLRKHQRALDRTQRELDRERTKLENQEKKLVQDIKKSANNGQVGACKIQAKDLVRTRRCVALFTLLSIAHLTDPTTSHQIHTEILPDAHATTSHLPSHSGERIGLLGDRQLLTSLTPQTVRSNEQMMQSMKGATMLLGSMNRQMNLPALQRIAMDFERENEVMDERQEMMDDAIDEATGMEGEEEEGEDIVKEVLDEIGVDLGQAVGSPHQPNRHEQWTDRSKQLGETPSDIQKETAGPAPVAQAIGGGGNADDDDLQARLDSLRR